MTTHSGILVWKIPGTGRPGMLQSMGSQRVGHDWATEQQQEHTYIFSTLFWKHLQYSIRFLQF